jgi:hypothetical protein
MNKYAFFSTVYIYGFHMILKTNIVYIHEQD